MNSFWSGILQLALLGIISFFFLRWFVGIGIGAPFLPARRRDVEDAITIAALTPQDVVIDLGSGDGRFLVAAATQGARVIGYELNPFLVWFSRFKLRAFKDAKVYRQNFFEADLAKVTVIFVFQMGHVMPRLAEKIRSEAPRAKLISVAFDLPDYETAIKRGVVKQLLLIDKNKEKG